MSKANITAVVLTKNEETNIARCLTSLSWCTELLVIDDYSTDQTSNLARKYQAKVIKHRLNADFAAQRNFAISQASCPWLLFVDADEQVSPELRDEIITEIGSTEFAGFYLRRLDYFCGFLLRHGEIGSLKILRLAKKGSGLFHRAVDEVWEVSGKTAALANPLYHYSHPDLTSFLQSINERSTLNAQVLFAEGKHVSGLDWFKPFGKFIFNYIIRLGFLDGLPGFVFAVLMSCHSFLVRGKLYLLIKRNGQG